MKKGGTKFSPKRLGMKSAFSLVIRSKFTAEWPALAP